MLVDRQYIRSSSLRRRCRKPFDIVGTVLRHSTFKRHITKVK